MKIKQFSLILFSILVLMSHLTTAQNTTFEFKGEKSTISQIMKPTDGKDGFEAEFSFEYCFVNCGAWKTPVLYLNRLGKPRILGYFRNGKYFSINTTDIALKKLIQEVDFASNIYMDVNAEVNFASTRQAIYNCINVLQNNSPNIGCFDGNTFVWFNEKSNENNRNKVKGYWCKIMSYGLTYSFLEGPCNKLNAYIDNSTKKQSLKKDLSALPENEFEKRLNIRRQLALIDPEDIENNSNIKVLEKKIAAKAQEVINNQKREEAKFVSRFNSEASQKNVTSRATATYNAPKSTDQIINDGANDIVSIIMNTRKRNEAYEEELRRKKEEEIELKEKRTQDLKDQKYNNWRNFQYKAESNPSDVLAWREATRINTRKAYYDYLSKFGDNAVFADVARSYYNGFRTQQSQVELDLEIKYAVGWGNWDLAIYLISLGANPNVEWYLDDGTYDGNILSKLFNSYTQSNYTDFPANSTQKQIQLLKYLFENNLDINQGNISYELDFKLGPTQDLNSEFLNAIGKPKNISKSKKAALLFYSNFISAFYESDMDKYFKSLTNSGSSEGNQNVKTVYTTEQKNQYNSFVTKYLDTLFSKLNVDIGVLVGYARVIQNRQENIFAELFYREPSEHLLMLKYLKKHGLNRKTEYYINTPSILSGLSFSRAMDGHPTATEKLIMLEYFDIGINPEYKTDFAPGSKSLYKFWKSRNPVCVDIWDNYKKSHNIK